MTDQNERMIPAYLLHNRPLKYGWLGRKEATLFPFFDHRGKTKAFLLLVPKRGETWFLEAKPKAFSLVEVSDGYTTQEVLTYRGKLPKPAPPDAEQLKRFSRLFHYDPWWLLDRPAFKECAWVPALKATNVTDIAECAGLSFELSLECTAQTLNLPKPEVKERKTPGYWSPISQWPKWRNLNTRTSWVIGAARK